MKTTAERFAAKFVAGTPDECWNWRGCISSTGYGSFRLNGRVDQAHRAAYLLNVGAIPGGLCVCHSCDNPLCVNPGHLWLGTKAENNRDKSHKGRAARDGGAPGETNYNTKLAIDDVHHIRQSTEPETALAQRFGVNRATIGKIKRGERWARAIGRAA